LPFLNDSILTRGVGDDAVIVGKVYDTSKRIIARGVGPREVVEMEQIIAVFGLCKGPILSF